MSEKTPVPGPEAQSGEPSPAAVALAKRTQALADLRAAREKKVKAVTESDEYQLAKTERLLREEEAIAEAEDKYGLEEEGKIGLVRSASGVGLVIVVPPSDPAFKRHNDAGSSSAVALTKLVTPCIKWPSIAEFELLCKAQPAYLALTGDMVTHLAGWKQQDFAKK